MNRKNWKRSWKLDEPTTYLDITYQVEILDLLTELNQKRKTTIVMVLHDINLSHDTPITCLPCGTGT